MPYQPSRRYIVVDKRRVGIEDLPASNLMAAVLGLKQSCTPRELVRVVGLLVEWLRDPRGEGLKRVFADWVTRRTRHWKHGRALLRRQEASRFGTMTAGIMSGVLACIRDTEGLTEVDEWLVRCESGSGFLARADPAAAGAG